LYRCRITYKQRSVFDGLRNHARPPLRLGLGKNTTKVLPANHTISKWKDIDFGMGDEITSTRRLAGRDGFDFEEEWNTRD
jgi:hypothetical protein